MTTVTVTTNTIVIRGGSVYSPLYISRNSKEWKIDPTSTYIGRINGPARITKRYGSDRLKYYFRMNSPYRVDVINMNTWCEDHDVDPLDWSEEDILAFQMEISDKTT